MTIGILKVTMKIEITYSGAENIYHWQIFDGPDCIDFASGTELDLSQCFEQIVKFRLLNALTYSDDVAKDINESLRVYEKRNQEWKELNKQLEEAVVEMENRIKNKNEQS